MTWIDLFYSVLTGLISSLLMLFFLYRLRPNLKISDEISERVVNGEKVYGFKIINRSMFPILDVNIKIEKISPSSVPGGQIYNAEIVPLVQGHFLLIGKFDKKDENANYAFRVRTKADLSSLWTVDGQHLRISVVGRHALSGFYGVFQHRFFTKGSVKFGSHRFGPHLNVDSIG